MPSAYPTWLGFLTPLFFSARGLSSRKITSLLLLYLLCPCCGVCFSVLSCRRDDNATTRRERRSKGLSIFLVEGPLAKKRRARKPSRAELKNNKRADQSLCQLPTQSLSLKPKEAREHGVRTNNSKGNTQPSRRAKQTNIPPKRQ